MALTQIKFAPGVDKQDTSVGAIGRWVDSDNVRWRYGLPEKVGGWQSLLTNSMVGVARKQHAFVDTEGNRYIAIGTDKFLLLFFEGQLFDITPLGSTISSATFTFNGTTTITITTSSAHNLEEGDIILFDNVTLPGGTGLNASDFEMVEIPKITRITVRQARKTIESLGFVFGEIEYVDDIARDEVISISHNGNELNEGDFLKRTSVIDFKLGNGKQ